jgi:hypothetical protein
MNRLERIHAGNVRVQIVREAKGQERVAATIVLVDQNGDEVGLMPWEQWIKGGREALAKGEW